MADSPLICVGDPRKGGSVGCFIVVRSHFRSVLRAVDRKSGSRWSARSAARTNDLEAGEDPPHTRSGRTRRKALWFKSSAASHVCECGAGDNVARAGAQPYLGPRTGSGDMMIDGVPGRRACERLRPLILSGKSTQQRGGDRNLAGASRRHQLKYGQGTRTTHLRQPLPVAVGPRAAPVRHHRGHAACDSSDARFCAPPPGWGSCRCGPRA